MEEHSKLINRKACDGEVFVRLEDMQYLAAASAERHAIEGHHYAAETMDNFASALTLLA